MPHAKVPDILRAFGTEPELDQVQGGWKPVRCVFSEGRKQIRPGEEGCQTLRTSARPGLFSSASLRTLAADLLHAMLPADCRICGGPMLGLSPVRVCGACVARVRSQAQAPDQLCSRCGDTLGMESARFAKAMGMHECTACRMNPPAFTRAVAFAPYDNEMREMLHALKFGGVRRVAGHVLSEWLAEAILRLEPETRAGLVVVPVPLFGERQKQRGYNQAELLALAAVRRLRKARPDWPLEMRVEALRRVRDTKAMFQLRPDQRRRNLAGAFEAGDVETVRGRDVLLVDDILTTGATADQCAKVLLKAGAKAVWVGTVTRAQAESVSAAPHEVARWDAGAVTGFAPASTGRRGSLAGTGEATG